MFLYQFYLAFNERPSLVVIVRLHKPTAAPHRNVSGQVLMSQSELCLLFVL